MNFYDVTFVEMGVVAVTMDKEHDELYRSKVFRPRKKIV